MPRNVRFGDATFVGLNVRLQSWYSGSAVLAAQMSAVGRLSAFACCGLLGCGAEPSASGLQGEVRLASTVCPPPTGDLRGTLWVVASSPDRRQTLGFARIEGADLVHWRRHLRTPGCVGNGPGRCALGRRPRLPGRSNRSPHVRPSIGDLVGSTIEAVDADASNVSVELNRTESSPSEAIDYRPRCASAPDARACQFEVVVDPIADCYPMLAD